MSNQELSSSQAASSTGAGENNDVPEAIRTEHGFALAVHQALRAFHRPDHLRDNPLLGSRLLAAALQRFPDTPPTQALRELLRAQCALLCQNPKSSRFQQVLQHTYLTPLRNHQAAADALHLSWSTYRRCLADATRMLSISLWESEAVLRAVPAGRRVERALAWPWYVAVALMLLTAAVGAGYLHFYRRRQTSGTAKPAHAENLAPATLAVLPFMSLNQAADSRYLSDGITDELITRLGSNPDLRVVARTSAFSLQGKPLDVRDVGRILGVRNVIEGSVLRTGHILRIHVALVSTRSGYELWSDEMNISRAEIFQTEGRIANAIMTQLHLPPESSHVIRADSYPVVNPKARDAYLVGMEYLNNRTVPAIRQAIAYFKKSIQEDSGYADSRVGLAMAYSIWRDYTGDEPPDTHYQAALSAAKQAVVLAPASPNAHAVLGLLYEQHWEWLPARREFQRALQLDPNDAMAHQWLAIYFWFTGDMQSAVKELRLARNLDPLSPIINADLGRALAYAGEPQQAAAQFRTSVALAPQFGLTYTFMAENDISLGKYQQALDDVQIAGNVWGNSGESFLLMERAAANSGFGRRDVALRELAELQRRASQHYLSGVILAWPLWSLGEKVQAYAQLQRAARDHDQLAMIIFGPDWAPIRADPRFAPVRKLMNLPLTTGLH